MPIQSLSDCVNNEYKIWNTNYFIAIKTSYSLLMTPEDGSGTNVGRPVAEVTVDQTDTFSRLLEGPLYLDLHCREFESDKSVTFIYIL
jgi:hypothetical protein